MEMLRKTELLTFATIRECFQSIADICDFLLTVISSLNARNSQQTRTKSLIIPALISWIIVPTFFLSAQKEFNADYMVKIAALGLVEHISIFAVLQKEFSKFPENNLCGLFISGCLFATAVANKIVSNLIFANSSAIFLFSVIVMISIYKVSTNCASLLLKLCT